MRYWLQRRDDAAKKFAGKTNFDAYFGGMKQGADFKQPDLAAVLTRIAEDGAADFYDGQTADLIAASMRGHGLITKRDLQEYTAVWRQPIQGDWNGLHVITAPPPSSGGVGLLQLLKMRADLQPDFKDAPLNSPQYMHLYAEMEKRVFADRAQYLGDPDFYKVPVAAIDRRFLHRQARCRGQPERAIRHQERAAGPRDGDAGKDGDDAFLGRRQMGQRRVEHLYAQRLVRLGRSGGGNRHFAQ